MTAFREQAGGHCSNWWRYVVGGALAVVLANGGPVVFAAQQEDPPRVEIPTTGMREGRITARHEGSVEINRKEFAFHPKIVFADDEGNLRDWKDFKRGDFVLYRLKQDRIDFLVLELPK